MRFLLCTVYSSISSSLFTWLCMFVCTYDIRVVCTHPCIQCLCVCRFASQQSKLPITGCSLHTAIVSPSWNQHRKSDSSALCANCNSALIKTLYILLFVLSLTSRWQYIINLDATRQLSRLDSVSLHRGPFHHWHMHMWPARNRTRQKCQSGSDTLFFLF